MAYVKDLQVQQYQEDKVLVVLEQVEPIVTTTVMKWQLVVCYLCRGSHCISKAECP